MLRMVLLKALEGEHEGGGEVVTEHEGYGEGEEMTGDEDNDEGEGGECEMGRSVSKTSSTVLCTTLVDTSFIDYSISSLFYFTFYHYFLLI